MIGEAQYNKVDDQGLHITVGDETKVIPVDNVVICAGQESLNDLYKPLVEAGQSVHLIGGAEEAVELDAKRAVDQATKLAAKL